MESNILSAAMTETEKAKTGIEVSSVHILLTSVGRRAYLVKYFKKALQGYGTIHVCNSEKTVAFKYADFSVISPLIYSDTYIEFLLAYCREHQITAVLSLFDMDLPVLSANKARFAQIGTSVIVSAPEVIDFCNDKWKTFKFLTDRGFDTPKTFLHSDEVLRALDSHQIEFPIMIKPRFGCGSILNEIAEDREALHFYANAVAKAVDKTYLKYESSVTQDKVVFQEYVCGQEYGADIMNDLEGTVRGVVIRKKLSVRAGETDVAELVEEPQMRELLCRLGTETKHIGNMDCDIIKCESRLCILEMNARFGGGFPFSYMGGADLCQAIVNWLRNEPVPDEMLTTRTGWTGYKEITIQEG